MIYDLETERIQENFNIFHKFSVPSVQDLTGRTPAGAGPCLGAGAHLPGGEEAQDLGGTTQGPGQGETSPDPGGTLRVQVRRRPLLTPSKAQDPTPTFSWSWGA